MNKKFIVCTIVLCVLTSFSCFCLATNIVNDVKNTINDAGESVMNATNDAGNTVINMTNDTNNSVMNSSNNVHNSTENTNQINSNNNNSYDASRTSTNTSATLLGMNSTMWTWLILGVAAIVIIALVWYYTAQNSKNFDSNNQ